MSVVDGVRLSLHPHAEESPTFFMNSPRSVCLPARRNIGQISMELVEVGKEGRTEELRRRLRQVQAQYLPSRAIYLPVGRRRHRVYRIAVEVCVCVCICVSWV